VTVRGNQLALDWFRNGTYEGAYDDVSDDVNGDPVVITYGRDQASATSQAVAGKLGFGLNNLDRRYSPENSASPIAGKVVPGTPTRYQVTSEDVITTLFGGVLDSVDSDPNAAAKTFTGEALDAWGLLSSQTLSTPVYQGLRTGDAVNLILDEVGWTGLRDIDAGATVMPFWWMEDSDAAAAMAALIRSEGPPAGVYVEGGTFVFRDRHARLLDTESQTSQGTFTHILPAGTGPAGDYKIEKGSFRYDHGLKNIANTVTFNVEQRVPGDQAEVWSSEDPITVATGQTIVLNIQAADPFINAITPVAGIDYIVDSGVATVTMSRDSGQSVTLSVTASSDAIISRMAVRATPITVARTVKVSYEDTASRSEFGPKSWPDDCGFANAYDAAAIASRIVAVYSTARPAVTFSIAYVHGGPLPIRYLRQILQRRIGHRVTVRNDSLGVNGDFYIERVTHTIRKLGLIHRVEFGCSVVEPVQPANIFTFDVAGLGFDDGAFGIEGIDNADSVFIFDAPGQGFDDGVFST